MCRGPRRQRRHEDCRTRATTVRLLTLPKPHSHRGGRVSRQRVNVAIAAGLHRQPFLMPPYRFEPAPVGKPDFALIAALLLRRHRACSVFENGLRRIAQRRRPQSWPTVHPCQPQNKPGRQRRTIAAAGSQGAATSRRRSQHAHHATRARRNQIQTRVRCYPQGNKDPCFYRQFAHELLWSPTQGPRTTATNLSGDY
ncbi:hypothetical protein ABIB66_008279 [Bradyrhizobium sp. F1.13.3]